MYFNNVKVCYNSECRAVDFYIDGLLIAQYSVKKMLLNTRHPEAMGGGVYETIIKLCDLMKSVTCKKREKVLVKEK